MQVMSLSFYYANMVLIIVIFAVCNHQILLF